MNLEVYGLQKGHEGIVLKRLVTRVQRKITYSFTNLWDKYVRFRY